MSLRFTKGRRTGSRRGEKGPAWRFPPPQAAALALLLTLAPRRAGGAGQPVSAAGDLEVSCREGKVTMTARSAPAPEVFAALARECGLVLRREELIPPTPVSTSYREEPLEAAVKSLVELTAIPSTLSAYSAKEPMTLYFLPFGTGTMPRAPESDPARGGKPKKRPGKKPPEGLGAHTVAEGEAAARDATTTGDAATLLAAVNAVDPDAGFVLKGLDEVNLIEDRDRAAREEALRRYLAATTDAERRSALEELAGLGTVPGTDEPWSPESVADERWRLSWERARNDFLLAGGEAERTAGLARLRELNADEADYLLGLAPELLAEEKIQAAVETLRGRYLLSRTKEDWRQFFEPAKRTPSQ